MKISNIFLAGMCNIIMAELQYMQHQPIWATLFGAMGAFLIIYDLFHKDK